MIRSAVAGLDFDYRDLIVTVLREHEDRFRVTEGLAAAFGSPIKTCVLERQTKSQSETVAETIRALRLDEPFLAKDSDGSFLLGNPNASTNYVCVQSLNRCDLINPRNKSYVRVDDAGRLTAIREKSVISDLFNVGGYFFLSPQEFLNYYDRLSSDQAITIGETYLSSVIASMLADGVVFRTRLIDDYRDWGTLHDWRRALGASKTLFVALDGFVLERGSPYFYPRFSEVKPFPQAVDALRTLIAEGIGIVYLSIRPVAWKDVTERQLAEAGLPPGPVQYDCPMTKWLFVGSPQTTSPSRATDSCELDPDHPRLLDTLRNLLHGES